ncbi:MAG: regulatory protein MarR [Amycolatopsis sp.]|jgi:DNA-binding MarR family transcriptional regulator|uniref:MarR family winged helix-turn-helix transcriptional regulator n=1 Tax=Amycolatopsis sp. TaxID=37632 RepID=UPI002618EC50|nr:MarR family transcriptional regulator [Amycolatopsis sp.]MCU1687978.1 regulatory protein MarR [Amycolatopsis sp.]
MTDWESGDPLALEQQVCFALVVAARNVVGVYKPLLEPMGLTHTQYLVMLALWGRAPLSVKELSRLLQLDPGTLSPMLKRLETAGLLVRQRNSDDERLLSVRLTTEGAKLREQALRIPPAVVDRLGMSLDDLKNLHTTLTKVIAATEELG